MSEVTDNEKYDNESDISDETASEYESEIISQS